MEKSEETKKARSVVARIRQLLLNYDLAITYANGEINYLSAEMKRLYGRRSKGCQAKFVNFKVEKERYVAYLEELENAKQELLDNINIVADKYVNKYQRIFVAYFIENRTWKEIAEETNYSFEAVKWIVKKLSGDLLDMFTL